MAVRPVMLRASLFCALSMRLRLEHYHMLSHSNLPLFWCRTCTERGAFHDNSPKWSHHISVSASPLTCHSSVVSLTQFLSHSLNSPLRLPYSILTLTLTPTHHPNPNPLDDTCCCKW